MNDRLILWTIAAIWIWALAVSTAVAAGPLYDNAPPRAYGREVRPPVYESPRAPVYEAPRGPLYDNAPPRAYGREELCIQVPVMRYDGRIILQCQ